MTTIDLQRKLSVQDQVRQDQEVGFGLLFHLVRAGELISPWWSQRRDKELRAFAKNSDHFSGAEWMIGTKLASVPYLVEARDSSVKAHVKLANQYQAILTDMVQFGQGWEVFWTKFFKDVWECDNGAFGEIIGEGDPNGPIKGPSLGLAHLDSTRCSRTSNPEFPIVYQDTTGRRYRFHHTRIVFRSQQPSTAAEMHNVGFCWLSRTINSVQRLIDVAIYNQEKLGSRPLRQIILAKGIDGEIVKEAIDAAGELMDNRGLRRYSQAPILAHPAIKDWDIELRDLASLPDGFDEKTTTDFAMFVIALSGGFPPRWLWPATSTGATKADAMYSHISGSGGGATWHLNMMRDLLSYSGRASDIGPLLPPKFLPKELRLVFDYQDDEQDKLQAEVRSTRAKTRQLDLNAGVVTVRVSREQALASGDITQAQFNHMELEDGRLPNGDDVLSLFSSVDNMLVQILDLGVDDPLAIDFNDPVDMMLEIEEAALDAQDQLMAAGSRGEREKVEQAIAALSKLKDLYQELVLQEIQQEQQMEEAQQEQAAEGEEEPQPGQSPEPPEEETEETEEKAFNFGAKVGQVISGQLARGAGGRFMSKSELSAQRSEMLSDLLGRLRSKRGSGGGRKGSAAGKREGNRETVAEKAGIEPGTLDAMAAMRKGDAVGPEVLAALEAKGLAETNPDGSVTMTTAGRSLLSAANGGDVDKAKKALAKAAEPEKVKKPKKPSGTGAKPKKTPEQIEAERERKKVEAEQKREQEQAQNRDDTFSEIADSTGVSVEDMQALSSFSEGNDIDDAAAEELTKAGFAKRDSDGNLVMTSDGRAMLSAGSKGDTRRALDVASAAREKVAKAEEREVERTERTQERADDKREDATDRRDKADGLNTQADEAESEAEEKVAKLEEGLDAPGSTTASNKRIRERVAETLRKAEERAAKLRERAESESARAGELEAEADELESEVAKSTDPFELKTQSDFGLSVRAAIRGLWIGGESFDFVDSMILSIRRQLQLAWSEGAKECGVGKDELTAQELSAREQLITSQFAYLPAFADDIVAGSKANGGKLGPLLSRGSVWINRYDEARNQAKQMACGDKKLKWVLGPTEHCSSCLKLSGKVKRGSQWESAGIAPQIRALECGGWRCACTLVATDDPMSKGPLPRLP